MNPIAVGEYSSIEIPAPVKNLDQNFILAAVINACPNIKAVLSMNPA